MTSSIRWARRGLATAAALFLACGSEPEPEPAPLDQAATAGEEQPADQDEPMVTSGTLGTLPQFAIETTLSARQREFLQCFTESWRQRHDLIAGEFQFRFRVDPKGVVQWVYPTDSTVGDLETERCLLELGAQARFPEPEGGEAEFSWSLAVDPMESVRPAVVMDEAKMESLLEDEGATVFEECIPDQLAGYRLTVYVKPGGKVLSVGSAVRVQTEAKQGVPVPSAAKPEVVECVVEQVEQWEFPDPGSYPGKVTFDLKQ